MFQCWFAPVIFLDGTAVFCLLLVKHYDQRCHLPYQKPSGHPAVLSSCSLFATSRLFLSSRTAWASPQWLLVRQDLLQMSTLIMYNSSQGYSGNLTVPYPDSSFIITGLNPVTTYEILVCEVTRPGHGPCQQTKVSSNYNFTTEVYCIFNLLILSH